MFNEAYAGTLPYAATEIASRWDLLYNFLVTASVIFFVLVVGGMIYFAIQYRHQKGHKPKYITGSHALEAVFVVFPTILLFVIFGWGYSVYHQMTQAPADPYEIRVVAKQWLWQFQYDTGVTTIGELYAPLNRPVKLIMTSEDVIHSFFVPNFRIKQDVVPGMYTSVWFQATVPGRHQIFCAEYCGTSHSGMLGKVIVLDDKQWKDWLRGKKPTQELPEIGIGGSLVSATEAASGKEPVTATVAAPSTASGDTSKVAGETKVVSLVDQGKQLTETKGCIACHTTDGTTKVGPSYKGLFGSEVTLIDGKVVRADDNYLRESIEYPQAKIVKGFGPVMPTFKGLLTENEIGALIAYIKSVK
jgi:cytochrome c oxidase subunit 2